MRVNVLPSTNSPSVALIATLAIVCCSLLPADAQAATHTVNTCSGTCGGTIQGECDPLGGCITLSTTTFGGTQWDSSTASTSWLLQNLDLFVAIRDAGLSIAIEAGPLTSSRSANFFDTLGSQIASNLTATGPTGQGTPCPGFAWDGTSSDGFDGCAPGTFVAPPYEGSPAGQGGYTGYVLPDPTWTGLFTYSTGNYLTTDNISKQLNVARYIDGVRLDLVGLASDRSAIQTYLGDGVNMSENWVRLGGTFTGTPTASWVPDGSRFDIFGIGLDNEIWRDSWTLSGWSGWVLLANNIAAQSSANAQVDAARYPGSPRIDLGVAGADGHVHQAAVLDGVNISSWADLGSPTTGLLGTPTLSWRPDGSALDVFVIGSDMAAYARTFSTGTGTWSSWSQVVRPPLVPQPSAWYDGAQFGIARYPGTARLDVFFSSQQGMHAIQNDLPDGSNISSTWTNVGGVLYGTPKASWRGDGSRLDLFAIGLDSGMYVASWTSAAGQWSSWQSLPGGVASG